MHVKYNWRALLAFRSHSKFINEKIKCITRVADAILILTWCSKFIFLSN